MTDHLDHASTTVVCYHVQAGSQPDVLLCNDNGGIEYAVCFPCADKIDDESTDQNAIAPGFDGLCENCLRDKTIGGRKIGGQRFTEGFWIRQEDGTYLTQEESFEKAPTSKRGDYYGSKRSRTSLKAPILHTEQPHSSHRRGR